MLGGFISIIQTKKLRFIEVGILLKNTPLISAAARIRNWISDSFGELAHREDSTSRILFELFSDACLLNELFKSQMTSSS